MQVWTNILSRISSDSTPSDAELLMVAQQADELTPIDQPLGTGDLLTETVVSEAVCRTFHSANLFCMYTV